MDRKLSEILSAEVSSRLWDFFLPEVKSGNPVVFCFHQELVDSLFLDLFKEHDLVPDGRALIDNICASFFHFGGDRVHIEEKAFETSKGGFTFSILFVAQQVLAVEDMVRDHSLSEDAYFPRLRARISSDLVDRSLNPFDYMDFKRLWTTFQAEIIKVSGTERSITFYGGEGLNKSRSYPISQALLSLEDLFRLRRVFDHSSRHSISPTIVRELLRKEKYNLSKRGQRLVRNPALKILVIDQLISFFGRPRDTLFEESFERVKADRTTQEMVIIRAYVYFYDWLSDCFSIAVLDSSQSKVSHKDAVVHLRSLLAERKYIALVKETPFQDNFSYPAKSVGIKDLSGLLILFNRRDNSFVQNVAKIYFNVPEGNFEKEPTDIGEDFAVVQLDAQRCIKPFSIENGQFVEQSSDVPQRLTWEGGLCVDRRSNVYLPTAPPTGLYFGERRIEGSYKLLVNGLKTTVGKFFELLKESDAYSFIVKVIGIGEINLDIFQVKDRAGDVVYGFKADAKGKLSPVPVEVDFDAGGSLVGFHTLKFIKANPTFRLTRLQVARLLDESCEHWQVADERSLQILNIGIESANINQVLKKVCKLKINLEKKAPDFILGQILVS